MTESDEAKRALKRFDVALQARSFEIDLFWKRSAFFWAFVAATLVGYASARDRPLATMLACFGMVCSIAWTLVNRGSKYWFENWEQKIVAEERAVTGTLFSHCEDRIDKGWWLSARHMSVTKLAIGLSDYVAAFWCVLVAAEVWKLLGGHALLPIEIQLLAFVGATVTYIAALVHFGRSTPPHTGQSDGTPSKPSAEGVSHTA
jgi:hypothetical protein